MKTNRVSLNDWRVTLALLITAVVVASCGKKHDENADACAYPTQNLQLVLGRTPVDIDVPAGKAKGVLLVLPGFNFPRQDWCEKSSLCKAALAEGYIVVRPEMGRSFYATRLYPETRKDWLAEPNLPWLADTLLPELQKRCLLVPGGPNFVIGLSTGGRGVAMLTAHFPDLFRAGASLSGDFDIWQMPGDGVNFGYLGQRDSFPDRWKGPDNVLHHLGKFKTPLYLAHGAVDSIIPVAQTQQFYDTLRKVQPGLPVELHLAPKGNHDYDFWDSEVKRALEFFGRFAPKQVSS